MDLAKISLDLKNFARNCSFDRFSWVSLGFGEKTRKLTYGFQILEAKTRRRLSLTSGRPILEPDRTGWPSGSGIGCTWTPLFLSTFTNIYGHKILLHARRNQAPRAYYPIRWKGIY